MSEHQQVNRTHGTQRRADEPLEAVQSTHQQSTHQQSDAGFDALLDEIDGLLENNAAEYVRSFVQKGGQ